MQSDVKDRVEREASEAENALRDRELGEYREKMRQKRDALEEVLGTKGFLLVKEVLDRVRMEAVNGLLVEGTDHGESQFLRGKVDAVVEVFRELREIQDYTEEKEDEIG